LISAKEALAKSRKLLAGVTSNQRTIELLKDLPQGHGSGLDADMVDGLHAVEIIAKAKMRVVGGGGGGGGSGSGDAISIRGKTVDDSEIGDGKALIYELASDKIKYSTPAGSGDMTKAAYATASASKVDTALNAEKLEGSTKVQVQDHAPKSHGNEAHSSTFVTATEIATHAGLTTGVHGVGAGTVAKVGDIATDANLSAAAQDAVSKRHAANGDTDLDATFEATFEKVANKGAVSGYAPLDAGQLVLLANIPATLTGKDADTVDTLHASAFAVAAKGVTNGDSHDHNGGDGAQIDHVNLANKGTNTHNSIDAFLASKAVAYGLCDLDVLVKVPAARMPSASVSITRTLTFSVVGTLAVLVSAAPALLVDGTLTIIKVKIVVKTKPTGAGSAVTVDVNKNGTTIFTTQDGRPSITVAGGLAIDDSSTPDVTALAENDILTIDVDAIGGTVAGADLTVEVVCTQAVTVTFT